ncbi:MAG: hypothetical protein WD226_09125 [Planctomycetota bacterium]
MLLACSALLTAAALMAASFLPAPTAAPQSTQFVSVGFMRSWLVKGDGAVYIRLEAFEEAKPDQGSRLLWFRSPATQTTATNFEDQALEVALFFDMAQNADRLLQIIADADRDKTGETLESAYRISGIGPSQ